MKIGIITDNIFGLSFALLSEKHGHDIIISDNKEDYVFNLNQKICLTNEPLIQSMLLNTKNFSATTSNLEVIKNSDIIFIFVTTPSTLDGNYDTKMVFDIVGEFYTASSLNIPLYNKKLIVSSTTNPGEVEQIQTRLNMFNIQVAYNPVFTTQGEIVKGFEQSDIVLIGTEYTDLSNELIKIYNKIQTTSVNAYIMSPKAAEITKIGINCFLTTKISYANMIGEIMIKAGIQNEIDMVLSAIGGDSRIGKKSLKYGFGFGGPYLPKNNKVLGHFSKSLGMELNLPLAVDDFNREHANFIKNYYIQKNPDKTIPFVMDNISYKKGSDILEESQQFQLCVDLLNDGYILNVIASDSIANKLSQMSESYNHRLKFFRPGTNPQGYKITLQ